MLIGLHGKKQAGKDTVCERMKKLLSDEVERVSFADKLYESAAAALGVTPDDLRLFKSNPKVGVAVVHLLDEFHESAPEGIAPFGEPLTIREFLQHYGTEAHRDIFGDNFWVDNVDLKHEGRIVVVTDVRFKNEAQAVIDAGGAVVHVVGPESIELAGDGHASEEKLPGHYIDYELPNVVRYDDFKALDSEVLGMFLRLRREGY